MVIGHTPVEAVFQIAQHPDVAMGVRKDVAACWRGVSSAEIIQHWSTSGDVPSERWAQLAAQDFLQEIDPANPLIVA